MATLLLVASAASADEALELAGTEEPPVVASEMDEAALWGIETIDLELKGDEIPTALAAPDPSEIPESLPLPEGGFEETDELLWGDELDFEESGAEEPGRRMSFLLPSGVTFDVGFETSLVYDDNIFLTENATSDTIFRFQPNLAVAFGDGRAKQETYFELAYRPTANVFFENDSENSFDQDISTAFQVARSKTTILGAAGFQRLSEATNEVGGRFDRQVYSGALEFAYAVTGKTSVRLRGEYDGYRYDDDNDFEDSDELRGEIGVEYALSPKTIVGVGYAYGELDFEVSGKQIYHQAFADVEWNPSDKLGVNTRFGIEYRDLLSDSQTIPLLEAGFTYRPREKTSIAFRAYNREEASPFIGGESFTSTGFDAELSQQIGRRFTVLVGGGFENAEYNGGTSDGPPSRSDDLWFTRIALRYQLRERFSLEAFYSRRENTSEDGGFGYENNQVGLSGSLLF
ncbi:MAG: outer membrane beta-barrel protein [Verrucomicrobiota bacterium]